MTRVISLTIGFNYLYNRATYTALAAAFSSSNKIVLDNRIHSLIAIYLEWKFLYPKTELKIGERCAGKNRDTIVEFRVCLS